MKQYKVGIFPMVGDLLHAGHIKALEQAKSVCDRLIVVMNCAPQRNNASKHKPIESIYERYTRLKALSVVDSVIPYEGEPDLELVLKTIQYDVRFIGDDHLKAGTWTGRDYEKVMKIAYYVIPRHHGLSSSSLRDRVYKAECDIRNKGA